MVSFVLVALWLVSTLLIKAWPVAWAVIGAGVPLLGWVTYVEGPMLGLAALLGDLINAPLEPRLFADRGFLRFLVFLFLGLGGLFGLELLRGLLPGGVGCCGGRDRGWGALCRRVCRWFGLQRFFCHVVLACPVHAGE